MASSGHWSAWVQNFESLHGYSTDPIGFLCDSVTRAVAQSLASLFWHRICQPHPVLVLTFYKPSESEQILWPNSGCKFSSDYAGTEPE